MFGCPDDEPFELRASISAEELDEITAHQDVSAWDALNCEVICAEALSRDEDKELVASDACELELPEPVRNAMSSPQGRVSCAGMATFACD